MSGETSIFLDYKRGGEKSHQNELNFFFFANAFGNAMAHH